MKSTASFILISLLLASISAGAMGGAGVGEVEDGAEEEK
jgi:ABC-type methionine transport system permease subunit